MPYVITAVCRQCNTCIAGCDSGAVLEGQDRNAIDITICIECGICAAECPFQAIVFEEESNSESPAP
jgi:Pyruvate/2-oxoacid:ferredoxin oxidoreductase delta subunit